MEAWGKEEILRVGVVYRGRDAQSLVRAVWKDSWRDGGRRAGDGLGNEELAKETWKSRDPAMGMGQGREGEDIESCHRFTHIEK